MTAFCCSIGSAQIIYSNNFTSGGSGTLEGTAPTIANTYAGGSSSATWVMPGYSTNNNAFLANGSIDFTQGNSAVLSFTPQSGYIYSLYTSVTLTASMNSWIGMGFSSGPTPSQNQIPGESEFNDANEGGGYNWLILDAKNNNVSYFAGKETGNTIYNSTAGGFLNGAGTYLVEVQLDTIGTLWSADAFVDGIEVGSTNYTANPAIKEVGLTENNPGIGSATFNSLEFTAQPAPEPTAFALTGLGMSALLLFYKKLKQA